LPKFNHIFKVVLEFSNKLNSIRFFDLLITAAWSWNWRKLELGNCWKCENRFG